MLLIYENFWGKNWLLEDGYFCDFLMLFQPEKTAWKTNKKKHFEVKFSKVAVFLFFFSLIVTIFLFFSFFPSLFFWIFLKYWNEFYNLYGWVSGSQNKKNLKSRMSFRTFRKKICPRNCDWHGKRWDWLWFTTITHSSLFCQNAGSIFLQSTMWGNDKNESLINSFYVEKDKKIDRTSKKGVLKKNIGN